VNAFELVAQFLLSGFMCEKTTRPILCNLQQFDLLKKQHFEKKILAWDYAIRHPALCA
jgi:hypothetical protein